MESPRFSVLLPTHNRADVLGFAIRSVFAQSDPDFELLIVADGCTDGTRDVVTAFDDRRIRFFDLPKAPHFGYASRNVALRQARGHFIAFAAHDDLLLPDHLASMGRLLEDSNTGWGYSRPLWVSTDGIIVPFCTNLGLPDEWHDFQRGNTIPAACVVHTRALLEQAGFWPEDVPSAADWVLWRRMLGIIGGPGAYLKAPTNLHFSADWKRSRFAGSDEVRRLVGIADHAPWWPAILRHTPSNEPEQATIWRTMHAGGTPWVTELRTAIDTVIDRLAWMAVREILPRAEAACAAKTQAEARAAAAREAQFQAEARAVSAAASADAARRELNSIRQSTSWRITAPLRTLARGMGVRG